MTTQDLIDFEKEIADIYATGAIKAPVHLRKGREAQLVELFERHQIKKSDWVFGYWDSHELALLKGVPREEVKQEILKGNSIALCFPEYNVYCSGIVGSLMGTAVGVAYGIKHWKKHPFRVFHFCGEMSAETGIFHESVKYATQHDLPITFVVCDNGVSVMTDTRKTWGDKEPWFQKPPEHWKTKIEYFKYTNEYPHSGLGKVIKF